MVYTLRAKIRSLLAYQFPLNKLANQALNFCFALTHAALPDVRLPGLQRKHVADVWLKSVIYTHSFFAQRDAAGVIPIIDNHFLQEYGQLLGRCVPESVIDSVAYGGDTAVHYLSRFRGPTTIALEPCPESSVLAKHNLTFMARAVDHFRVRCGMRGLR